MTISSTAFTGLMDDDTNPRKFAPEARRILAYMHDGHDEREAARRARVPTHILRGYLRDERFRFVAARIKRREVAPPRVISMSEVDLTGSGPALAAEALREHREEGLGPNSAGRQT